MNYFGLTWNSFKVKNLTNDDILRIYTVFCKSDKIINDNNLKERSGSSGVCEFGTEAVKIVMFEKINARRRYNSIRQ